MKINENGLMPWKTSKHSLSKLLCFYSGLNFDMNSAASQDLSSTWAAALPKLMTRRGALIGVATGSNSSQQHNSIDSEISYSVRR